MYNWYYAYYILQLQNVSTANRHFVESLIAMHDIYSTLTGSTAHIWSVIAAISSTVRIEMAKLSMGSESVGGVLCGGRTKCTLAQTW